MSGMLGPWLTVLFLSAPPACAWLRVSGDPAGSCRGAGPGQGTPMCDTGLPPGTRHRLLSGGRACAGGHLYEPVPPGMFARPGSHVPLPEAAVIARLCGANRGPRPVRRRWWFPAISVSVERGLMRAADGSRFLVQTTAWVSLSFPLSAAVEVPKARPFVGTRRRRELCAASARLARAFARVTDADLRTRARLQLMAWRDELSLEESDVGDPPL